MQSQRIGVHAFPRCQVPRLSSASFTPFDDLDMPRNAATATLISARMPLQYVAPTTDCAIDLIFFQQGPWLPIKEPSSPPSPTPHSIFYASYTQHASPCRSFRNML